MVRIVAICMFLATVLTGCQRQNSYVQVAKENGYLYAFDKVSWGMTIADCVKALKLKDNEFQQREGRAFNRGAYAVEEIHFNRNLDGTDVEIVLFFNDYPPSGEGTEWLANIDIKALDNSGFTKIEIDALLASVVGEIGSEYIKVPTGGYKSPLKIDSYQDQEVKRRAVDLMNIFAQGDYDPMNNIINTKEDLISRSLDFVNFFPLTEDYDNSKFTYISLDGTTAALIALATHERTL